MNILFKKTCIVCKKTFYISKHRINIAKYCSRKCQAKDYKIVKSGERHNCWKNGRSVSKISGYVSIYCPNHPNAHNNRVAEHRLVMEKHIGRYLEPFEVVHHIDGNRSNNNIQNLIILNKMSHGSLHHPKINKWSRRYNSCIICNKTVYPHNAHGYCKHCYSLNRKKFTSQLSYKYLNPHNTSDKT